MPGYNDSKNTVIVN